MTEPNNEHPEFTTKEIVQAAYEKGYTEGIEVGMKEGGRQILEFFGHMIDGINEGRKSEDIAQELGIPLEVLQQLDKDFKNK